MISKLKFIDAIKMAACYVRWLFGMLERRIVDVTSISKYTMYTIRGSKFYTCKKTKIGDHTGVPYSSASVSPLYAGSSHPLYGIIRDLPLDKTSVHDIHLKFSSPQIYVIVSSLISNHALGYDYTITPRSMDIRFRIWEINGLRICVTIHKTDTITVVIGCSSNPISLDVNGVARLTDALSVVENRLSRIVKRLHTEKDHLSIEAFNPLDKIPTPICTIPLILNGL